MTILGRALQSVDLYGHSVSLTYNKKSSFSTSFGGLITLIGFGIMGFYLYLVYQNIANHDYDLTENQTYLNPAVYP